MRNAHRQVVPMNVAAAASLVEKGLPPPPLSSSNQQTTAGRWSPTAGWVDPPPRLPTRLLVRQITGEQTTLHLSLNDTVGTLKEALRAEWGIEADAQRLLLANEDLLLAKEGISPALARAERRLAVAKLVSDRLTSSMDAKIPFLPPEVIERIAKHVVPVIRVPQDWLLAQDAFTAGGDDAEVGGEVLPLEEPDFATLRACGLLDGAELLLTVQDAAQGARRRMLRSHWLKELRNGSVVKHEGRVGVVALVVSIDEPGDHRYSRDTDADGNKLWVLKSGTKNTVRLYWEDGREMSGYVDKDKLYPPSSEEASVPWVIARQKRVPIIRGCTKCCHAIWNCLEGCLIYCIMLGVVSGIWMIFGI